MNDEIEDIEPDTCEICEKPFPRHELEADDWYGPPTCEECREWARFDAEHYRETDIWLSKNK